MALTEGATSGILPTEANRRAFSDEAPKRDRLRVCPVDIFIPHERCAALVQKVGVELGMDMEFWWKEQYAVHDELQRFTGNTARRAELRLRSFRLRRPSPLARSLVGVEGFAQTVSHTHSQSLKTGFVKQFVVHHLFAILGGDGRVLLDIAILNRLRICRIVGLIV